MGLLPKWLRRLLFRRTSQPTTSNESGRNAEAAAEAHLLASGHRLLARNLRGRGGEIDLITLDPNGTIVVVEVRSLVPRPGFRLDQALPKSKQEQVVQAARRLLPTQRWWKHGSMLRFDAVMIELDPSGKVQRIEHYPNAFQPRRRDWF